MAALTRRAWAGTGPPASGVHGETEARVREDLELGAGLVLEVDGVPAGSVRWFPDPVANAWEVLRLGVAPEFRRGGWGRRLMDEVARRAHLAAVPELRVFVEPAKRDWWRGTRSRDSSWTRRRSTRGGGRGRRPWHRGPGPHP